MRRVLSTQHLSLLPGWVAFACAVLCLAAASGMVLAASPALALSEIQRQDSQGSETTPTRPSDQTIEQQTLPPVDQVPIPDSTAPSAPDQPAQPDEVEPGDDNQPGDS